MFGRFYSLGESLGDFSAGIKATLLYAAFSLINDISVGRSALIMRVFPQIKRQDFKSLERRPVISQTRDGLRGDGRRIVRWEGEKEYEMPTLSMICTAAMLRKNFDTLVCAVLN